MCDFLIFNFVLVTWKKSEETLTFELVTRSHFYLFLFFYFELVTWVSKKVEKELVNRKNNFEINFWVSISKSDVILRNSVS